MLAFATMVLLQAAQPNAFQHLIPPRPAPPAGSEYVPPCPNRAAQCDPWERYGVPVPPGWEYVATTEGGSVWFVHPGSIGQFWPSVRIWVHMDHSRDRTISARRARGLLVFNCPARQYHWESVRRYAANGSQIGPSSGSREDNVPPDSLIDLVMQRVCVGGH